MPKAKPRFIPYNLDQNAMVVINYRDQLQPGTFEHAVRYLRFFPYWSGGR